jgi:hypothetical protein
LTAERIVDRFLERIEKAQRVDQRTALMTICSPLPVA